VAGNVQCMMSGWKCTVHDEWLVMCSA